MAEAMRAVLTEGGLEAARTESSDALVARRLAVSPWRACRDAGFEARY
ncbi:MULTISPECIES: hypothetical protein [Amycolatopsis]|uniref:Uncharacterized protein n=1 Tax=Amycolatopsis albidoflavus TaxID=102226 RepID=A0ABW5IGB5_9PSEU